MEKKEKEKGHKSFWSEFSFYVEPLLEWHFVDGNSSHCFHLLHRLLNNLQLQRDNVLCQNWSGAWTVFVFCNSVSKKIHIIYYIYTCIHIIDLFCHCRDSKGIPLHIMSDAKSHTCSYSFCVCLSALTHFSGPILRCFQTKNLNYELLLLKSHCLVWPRSVLHLSQNCI